MQLVENDEPQPFRPGSTLDRKAMVWVVPVEVEGRLKLRQPNHGVRQGRLTDLPWAADEYHLSTEIFFNKFSYIALHLAKFYPTVK
jgi:hypothetical protein